MTRLKQIIDEIHRHKGVLLPDDNELGWYCTRLFSRACEELGLGIDEYKSMVQPFVLNKYKQVLDHCIVEYHLKPNQQSFEYKVKWDELEERAHNLAERYRNGL